MNRSAVTVFFLSICVSCKASADFSSDLQNIGLLLGVAETGGCAEAIRDAPGDYRALMIAVPTAHCSAEKRLGTSYSEYLALHSRELALGARYILAPASECSLAIERYHKYVSTPSALEPDGAVFVSNAADFLNTAVFPVADIAYEASPEIRQVFASIGVENVDIRSASYRDYMVAWSNFTVATAIAPSGDPTCTESIVSDAVSSVIPGWKFLNRGDVLSVTSRVVAGALCSYGSNVPVSSSNCATLGPQF